MRIDFRMLFMVFVLTIPFLHAFALSAWLPLPLCFASFVFLTYVIKGNVILNVNKEDIFILCFILLGLLPNIFFVGNIGIKNVTHTLAWGVSIFIFYFWCNTWLRFAKISLLDIGKVSTIALLLASIGVIADFVLANTYGMYLSDIMPYSFDEMDVTQSLGGLFYRPRGFSAEPGFTAMVFEMFFPLSWIYLRSYKGKKWIVYSFSLMAYLLLTSAASICSFILAICVFALIFFSVKTIKLFLKSISVVFVVFIFCWVFFPDIFSIFGDVYHQVIGEKANRMLVDDDIRIKIYKSLTTITILNPQGVGFGTISRLYFDRIVNYDGVLLYGPGAINLYVEVLVATGILGFVNFMLFVFCKIRRVYNYRMEPEVKTILFAFLIVFFHHFFLSEIWFPMFWFLLVLANNMLYFIKNRAAVI